MRLAGLDVSSTHLLLWNGQQVEVYQLDPGSASKTASFECASSSMALHKESIFKCGQRKVQSSPVILRP